MARRGDTRDHRSGFDTGRTAHHRASRVVQQRAATSQDDCIAAASHSPVANTGSPNCGHYQAVGAAPAHSALGRTGSLTQPELSKRALHPDVPNDVADQGQQEPEAPKRSDGARAVIALVHVLDLVGNGEHEDGLNQEIEHDTEHAAEAVAVVLLQILARAIGPEEPKDAERDDGEEDDEAGVVVDASDAFRDDSRGLPVPTRRRGSRLGFRNSQAGRAAAVVRRCSCRGTVATLPGSASLPSIVASSTGRAPRASHCGGHFRAGTSRIGLDHLRLDIQPDASHPHPPFAPRRQRGGGQSRLTQQTLSMPVRRLLATAIAAWEANHEQHGDRQRVPPRRATDHRGT